MRGSRPPVLKAMRLAVVLLLACAIGLGCASSGSKKRKQEEQAKRRRSVLYTSSDDARMGAEAARSVQAEIGLLDDDPELTEYVQRIGKKVLRALPRREFAYHFEIVDQMEPNAFALPGGYIFISRGLLALVNNESELACVIGHEIIHSARRHSAQQQEVARAQGFSLPFSRAATLAAYGRDMEREADELGQRLCAAAGYDPMALSTFLRRLDQRERLLIGAPRSPTFLDSHPGSRERASLNSARASELRWTPNPELGDDRGRVRYLERIDGMVIGDRVETGVFVGDLFLHPVLDFEMRFPKGWMLQNSAQAVGATAPRREAVVYLTGDLPAGDLVEVADEFAEKAKEDFRATLKERKRVRVGSIDAVRYSFSGSGVAAKMTFFPFAGGTWRMVGLAPKAAEGRYFGQILLSMRSFGPISPEHRKLIHSDVLQLILARRGETVVDMARRSGTVLDPSSVALLNGLFGNEVFEGGELLKVVRRTRPDLIR